MRDIVPPHLIESEKLVLCSALLDLECLDEILAHISIEDMYFDSHRRILSALKRQRDRGEKTTDIHLVKSELKQAGDAGTVGDDEKVEQYLQEVLEKHWSPEHAEKYAKEVRRAALWRKLLRVADDIHRSVDRFEEEDVEAVVSDTERELFKIIDGSAGPADLHISASLEETYANIVERMDAGDGIIGLSTGIESVDQILGGMRGGRLMVLAAQPGVGKTAFLCSLTLTVARRARAAWEQRQAKGESIPARPDGGVLVISLEMGKGELNERLLSLESRVDNQKLARGTLDHIDGHALTEGGNQLCQFPIYVEDTAAQSIARIEAICRRIKRKESVALIALDYIHLVKAENDGGKGDDVRRISEITRRLKLLAKELDTPILALSQMSREIAKREDKRPQLSDLRGSGSIEQDADIVMFLHRPCAFDQDARPGEADLIVAKNRSGPTGTAALAWVPRLMMFADRAPSWTDPS